MINPATDAPTVPVLASRCSLWARPACYAERSQPPSRFRFASSQPGIPSPSGSSHPRLTRRVRRVRPLRTTDHGSPLLIGLARLEFPRQCPHHRVAPWAVPADLGRPYRRFTLLHAGPGLDERAVGSQGMAPGPSPLAPPPLDLHAFPHAYLTSAQRAPDTQTDCGLPTKPLIRR
jgi:hypothetical protein